MTAVTASAFDNEWDNVLPGIWYGQVVTVTPEGETDYFYAYSNVKECAPDVDLICPEGHTILERTLKLTGHGRDVMALETWAFEDQIIPSE